MNGKKIVSFKAYKLKLHIKDFIKEKLAQYAANCRFVYNWGLQRREDVKQEVHNAFIVITSRP